MIALREKVKKLGLESNLRVERLDVLDPYDVGNALRWDMLKDSQAKAWTNTI